MKQYLLILLSKKIWVHRVKNNTFKNVATDLKKGNRSVVFHKLSVNFLWTSTIFYELIRHWYGFFLFWWEHALCPKIFEANMKKFTNRFIAQLKHASTVIIGKSEGVLFILLSICKQYFTKKKFKGRSVLKSVFFWKTI